jgi:FOG: Transposase
LRDKSWTEYCIKETDKGPMIWEVKECEIFIREEARGVSSEKPLRLIVARNVLVEDEKEIKFNYFVTNASQDAPFDDLLLAAFSRWRVERTFQDSKQKLGLDHYEGRNYTGLIRHLLLCSLAYDFLQTQWFELSKKQKFDDLPSHSRHGDGVDAAQKRVACIICQQILPGTKRTGNLLPQTNKTQTNHTKRIRLA